MEHTLTVPDWIYQAYHYVVHNWTTVAGVIVVAILASIVVELLKRHTITTDDKTKLKKIVAYLLVVFSTLFSALAYVIFFAQSNLDFLQSLPVIGSHTTEALGVAYLLYNLRLNKYYTSFATWAGKWTKTKPVTVSEPAASADTDLLV